MGIVGCEHDAVVYCHLVECVVHVFGMFGFVDWLGGEVEVLVDGL